MKKSPPARPFASEGCPPTSSIRHASTAHVDASTRRDTKRNDSSDVEDEHESIGIASRRLASVVSSIGIA